MQEKDFTITHVGGVELIQPMPFIYIPAKGKTFMFQADDGSNLGSKNEGIPITFENDFWMCAFPCTQDFWYSVVIESAPTTLKAFPSYFNGKTRPVDKVSWDDIQIFYKALNRLFLEKKLTIIKGPKLEGKFSLPSETQWEYAADAGLGLVFSGSQNLHDVGWFTENSNNQTMPVGLKQPNTWGLFDMSGNVWEWCADIYAQNIKKTPKNGQPNLEKGQLRVLRGGSYFDDAEYCRLRNRGSVRPVHRNGDLGFRLVFSPSSAHES